MPLYTLNPNLVSASRGVRAHGPQKSETSYMKLLVGARPLELFKGLGF